MLQIVTATTPEDFAAARRLIDAYAGSLNIDLDYQNFREEFAAIEEVYALPGGCLLLARRGNEAVGCVGVRRVDELVCEMKRLYVLPSERGSGAGRALANAAIVAGRELGYQTMCLDTLATMPAAQRLYRDLGFHETAPYYDSPHQTVFMARKLQTWVESEG